ncbi:hypothetical protein BDV95DRAFT_499175 [Massariosphaeria phaeospora]|uniref:MYND-type domain-containing protein n=1 Tax=Massariosphaeria phaeospora TaxID=100035 RepID=A0A7C8MBR4_9PLEO|nr:hypothetical protein BDV95DRAFT_499175 [Massariosphaeria phaeospora]
METNVSNNIDLSAFLNPSLCANNKQHVSSELPQSVSPAGLRCSSCKLVQYCSKACQSAHWRKHKNICKSDLWEKTYMPGWLKDGQPPSWLDGTGPSNLGPSQYSWGNMPALNILKMKDNEGIDNLHRDMSLLFGASGDLGNVVKTVAELPENYDGECSLVLNDMNFAIVARNAMLLLTALTFDPHTAISIMIHLWYSASMPSKLLRALQDYILPLIDDVCGRINNKEPDSFQAKTWNFGTRSLRLQLQPHEWRQLRNFVKVPAGVTPIQTEATRRRIMLAPERVDYLHRTLFNQPPAVRVATLRLREDGILLPYGASKAAFDTPNPTLFQNPKVWPMRDDASPLAGWEYKEHIRWAPMAVNDVTGSLFFYIKDVLLHFCQRVHKPGIHFGLHCVNATVLPSHLKNHRAFDRIEIWNICDRGYIGAAAALRTFVPLLQPITENPHAALLSLFMTAVTENYDTIGAAQRTIDSVPYVKRFLGSAPHTPTPWTTPSFIRLTTCYCMFGDFENTFKTFVKDNNLIAEMRALGVKPRKPHTIVEPCPLRITLHTSQEEFERRCVGHYSGSERYMEIVRWVGIPSEAL